MAELKNFFVDVKASGGVKYINTYTGDDRPDKSRDDKIAFLSTYGTIATQGEVFTGGTKGDITVAGGPLADDTDPNWPSEWYKDGNKYIPANTDLQTILTYLFYKPENGTIEKNYTTWNPKNSAPDANITPNGEVEVGTKIVPTFSANQTVTNNSVTAQIKASKGYFVGNSTVWNNPAESWKNVETVAGSTTGTATVSATLQGSSVTSGATDVYVEDGKQTLSVSQTGITAKHSGDFSGTYYYASTNSKQRIETSYVIIDDKTYEDKTLESSNTATVTGKRYMWVGTLPVLNSSIDSALVRALDSNGRGMKKFSAADPAWILNCISTENVAQIVLAMPTDRTLKEVINLKTSLSEKDRFKENMGTVSTYGANNKYATNYNYWYWATDDITRMTGGQLKFEIG